MIARAYTYGKVVTHSGAATNSTCTQNSISDSWSSKQRLLKSKSDQVRQTDCRTEI